MRRGFAASEWVLMAWLAGAGASAQPIPETPARAVEMSVDLGRAVGAWRPAWAWFGYDEGNYTTAANGRALLGELHGLSEGPVTIRVHHLLTSGDGTAELKWSSTGVYREDASGKPVYDFKLLDGIFDAFRAAGVRPMVELGFMPKDLAAVVPGRTEPYQVHFPADVVSGASNNSPKDYKKWGELCRVVTAHLVERYGRETVKGWLFEVWNEPDIGYWHGSAEDYWRLYDYAVAGVRAALPEAQVGGPATTSPRGAGGYAFLKGFLEHVETGKNAATGGPVPLDFISFHAKGQPEIKGGAVTMGIAKELTDAERGFALVAEHPALKKLPIVLSEADPEGCAACSSKMNPANNYRNGTLYPAYTAAAYARLLALAEKHGVNLAGMLSWSFEFEGREYFDGFRSLATNGVDKPVLNYFRMAGLMEGQRVAVTSTGAVPMEEMLRTGVRGAADVDGLATRAGRRAAVMVWNYSDKAEGADEADAAQTAGAGSRAAAVQVAVRGLPREVRRVLVTEFRVDGTHSNAYTVWKAMGSPQQPTAEELARLKAAGGLELLASPRWMDVSEGRVTVGVRLPGESVELAVLTW